MSEHVRAPALSPVALDRAVSSERRHLADTVAGLTDEQWPTPSLCNAWSVRDVVAHLATTTRTSLPQLLRSAVRARGDFDRMAVDLAARRGAGRTTAELVVMLRESAGSTRRMPGSAPMDPLADLVVHAQDIARPLGLHHSSPPEVVAACLAHVAPNRFLGGPQRLSGLSITSTDTGWSLGEGAEVSGPGIDLLLAVSGRRAGLAALTGPGVPVLAARLTQGGASTTSAVRGRERQA